MRQLLLILLMLAATATGWAQDDERALGAAVDTIVRTGRKDYIVNRIVEDVYQNHPTATLASRIAKAYYHYTMVPNSRERIFYKRDTAMAFKYINRAVIKNPKLAEPYILASDILDYERKPAEAKRWLDTGIAYNPTDSSLYATYAAMLALENPDAAVAKLMELKSKDPSFPIDLHMGRLYYKLYSIGGSADQLLDYFNKQAAYYGRVFDTDRDLMNAGDLGAYVNALQWANENQERNWQRAYEASSYGVDKFHEDTGLRLFYFYSCWGVQKWEEGASAFQYLHAVDSTKLGPLAYIRYGVCLRGAKRYAEAIAQYEHVLQMPEASEKNKEQAEGNIVVVVSAEADEARKAGDYQRAVDIIRPYVEKYKAQGRQIDRLVSTYASIYMVQSIDLSGPEKEEALMKADQIFAEAIPHTKDNDDLFAYQRYVIYSNLDPTKEKGLAVPYINEVVRLITSKKSMDKGQRMRLINVYLYMALYELEKGNKKGLQNYAEKVLDLDPTNEDAIRFLNFATRR